MGALEHTFMDIPTPTPEYIGLQAEQRNLKGSRHTPPYKKLESLFRHAFGFSNDRFGIAKHIEDRHCCLLTTCFLDHMTCYQKEGEPVIVTQPYVGNYAAGENTGLGFAQEWRDKLSLGPIFTVDITPANAWAFYYPGCASLFVLKFPRTYNRVAEKIKELDTRIKTYLELCELKSPSEPEWRRRLERCRKVRAAMVGA